MGSGYVGTSTLSSKLTRILYTHIKHNLPDIIKEMSERIKEVSDRLTELGTPMPEKPDEKLQMAWSMVLEFCQNFKNAIAGKAISCKDRKEVYYNDKQVAWKANARRSSYKNDVLPSSQGIYKA